MSRRAHLAATVLRPLWKVRSTFKPQPRGQRVLTYHAVGETRVPDDVMNLYTVTPSRFAEHMKCLARSGRRVRPLRDALSDEDSIAITFDDGYRDTLDNALPILEQHGFPFTVFVNASFVRSSDPIYLRPSDVKELATKRSVDLGAHGTSHRRLSTLDDDALRTDLVESRSWLEELVGKSITTMSYPHGDVDARVQSVTRDAGFERAWSGELGINTKSTHPLLQRRTVIWSTDDTRVFDQKLAGEWDWLPLVTRS